MGQEFPTFLGAFGVHGALKRWQRALKSATPANAQDLKAIATDIADLRTRLDQLGAEAAAKLRESAQQAEDVTRPDQCDWIYRPDPWSKPLRPRGHVHITSPHDLGGSATLFHDGTAPQMGLRQDPVTRADAGAAFCLVLEVYRSDASFVSLVQTLPQVALDGLTRSHYISARLTARFETSIECYARLNIQHGPNVEQMVRQIDFRDGVGLAEFDLAYTKINEKRLERAWLEVILESPQMTRVVLEDMVLLRALRADV